MGSVVIVIGRIPVLDVQPVVEGGRWAAKAVVGETFTVSATVFRDGHDAVGATAVLIPPGGTARQARRTTMTALPNGYGARGTDSFSADVTVDAPGAWKLIVEGWADAWATWHHHVEAKLGAGQGIEELAADLETGALLLERAKAKGLGPQIKTAIQALRDESLPPADRAAPALAIDDIGVRDLVSPSAAYPLWVDRERALVGCWYELFPRSFGGLKGTAAALDRVAALGADVVYLPPIHPIGKTHRKGPNNTLTPGPEDPGSPWAIGSEDGGHDAVAPELGTIDDLDFLVKRAAELDMEIALDLALQCSPDHPWVTSHPEFFHHRPDGTIAYAENPPKKYQDIYPLDFDSGGQALRDEVLRVVRHWMDHGIRIFRVDNPHTKPVDFWEWLIAEVHKTDPDVLFLAEAFTRPPMLHTLAMVGFTQSYTYFTWRNDRWDLEQYLRELTTPPGADYLRPNLFVNTPDILHAYLQQGGLPAFRIRATIAATAGPTWGIYSGYELGENVPLREGSEEYLHSEKYEVRVRDFTDAPISPLITRLNEVRREHLALQRLRGIVIHAAEDPAVLAYSRRVWDRDGSPDTILTIVSLDPHATHETWVHLDTGALGVTGERFLVHDQIGGRGVYEWGDAAFVRLSPDEPAHVMHVTHLDGRPA
ncbi:MAG TPA: alpha-1,4-glucan--maltose-1-phosphate maltosyltransferase [Mycobacteriales bacterium]|nr:alpha-1,4-glucan--maltose-1-phosphate maltosyltransferase [Mycobacteriales bacterium]